VNVRWVDKERVENILTSTWLDDAREAQEEIDRAPDEKSRKKVLKDRDDVWQDAKLLLKRVMDNKCWYCETPDDRSDNAVDHFRPKSRYWWLAFDYKNMRFSCTFCNSRRIDREGGTSGGKQDNFPIEGTLAMGAGDSLEDEEALLLDPCEYEDPPVLWFDETGQPSINPEIANIPREQKRFKESVLLYHLDHGPLTTLRRRKYLDVISACKAGDACYNAFLTSGDIMVKKLWWERIAQVRRLIDRSSPHSAAARCAALGLKASSATAERALQQI
jgi:uncharacterized protein (TIGR02646 family)